MYLSKLLIKVSIITMLPLALSGCENLKKYHQEASQKAINNKIEEGSKFKIDKNLGPNVPSLEATMAENAKKAFDAGHFEKASQIYAQLMIGRDNNPEYRLGYANSLRVLGQADKAMEQYELLLASDPTNLDAQEGKALTYMLQGRFADAVNLFRDVMAKDALRWRTINALGICLTMTNRFDEAISYFRTALQISPDNPAILNNIALAFSLAGKDAEAIQVLEAASQRLSPTDPRRKRIDLNLSLFYAMVDKLDAAERVARLHLNEVELANNMGLYANLAKNKQLARAYLNKALAESPTHYQKAWDNLRIIEDTHSLADNSY